METTMLKTISAALLAASVIAAPAFAGAPAKSATKTAAAPVTTADQARSKVLSANATMGHHHRKHASLHRRHKHMAAPKAHATPKAAMKRANSPSKRG
jgi:hypothetical protein